MVALGRSLVLAGALCGALALGSCGNLDSSVGDGGSNGQQDAGWQPQPGVEAGVEASVDPNPNPNDCHDQTFTPTKVGDPDMMLLMDMSSSMDDGSTTPSKYTITSQAVGDTITSLGASSPIAWGLVFFPSDGDCGVNSTPDVPIAVGDGSQIVSMIESTTPNGNTPTHKAVLLATDYYGNLNDGRGHYILVATDGEPNCETATNPMPTTCTTNAQCAAQEQCQPVPGFGGICVPVPQNLAIKAIAAALAVGIKTYVVGIDTAAGDSDTLNQMADAGGTARTGATHYYPVTDQSSLESALQNITSQIISCTFSLDQAPMDINYVTVTIGGASVAQDTTHTSGWDIDTGSLTLTFYGQSCSALQSDPQDVQIVYGCPPPA